MAGASERVHATAIAAGPHAALIFGPPGSGKSDLALRCLAVAPFALSPHPARLVADDQVLLQREGNSVFATAPAALLGKLEVRGVGIVDLAPAPPTRVTLAVELVAPGVLERFPDPWPRRDILGLSVPILQLWAFECAAAAKILIALSNPALAPPRP